MSQHDMNIENQGFPAFRSDLNDALAALASTSAGATAPSTTFAQQLWYDSTANLLKMRNTDNDAWITLAYFDQTNDEWEIRSAVIQAVDSAGVVIKTDDGTTRLTVADNGNVTITNQLTVSDGLIVDNDGATVATFDRATSDGKIVNLQRDGLDFGSIDSAASGAVLEINSGDIGLGLYAGGDQILPRNGSGSGADNKIILGSNTQRFKDLYLSGGVYLGGTGAANYLDDYEEGTFTPTWVCSTSGSVTPDTTSDLCSYVKVGSLVTVTGRVRFNSVSSPVGALYISNLPFAASSVAEESGEVAASGYIASAVSMNSTDLIVRQSGDGSLALFFYSGGTTNPFAPAAGQIQAGTAITFTCTYLT